MAARKSRPLTSKYALAVVSRARRLFGWSVDEVAARLDSHHSTVRKWLHKRVVRVNGRTARNVRALAAECDAHEGKKR